MFKSFRVGSLFGIPLKLDVTFLVILPIFAWLISTQIETIVEPLNATLGTALETGALTAGYRPYLLGTAAALGLFVGVFLHELGHSLVALRFGYAIESITLWILGGVAQFSETPEDWRHEFAISIAGPIVSVGLGVASYLALFAIPPTFDGAIFVFAYLAILNVFLAAFNMLPAFPMDGGRVLRAVLARSQPFARATQQAASVGKGFAFLLGLVGLLWWNPILIAVAFFVYIAASGEARHTVLRAAFEGVDVRAIMTGSDDLDTVSPNTTIDELFERMFSERHTGYPVVDDSGRPVGMVTLEDAREVDAVEREAFTVEDVMSRDLKTVSPEQNAMDAFETIQEHGIGRLLVVDGEGSLVGLLSRTDLMTAFRVVREGGSLESESRPSERPATPRTQ